MYKKALLATTITAALATNLTACGGGGKKKKDPAPTSPNPVTTHDFRLTISSPSELISSLQQAPSFEAIAKAVSQLIIASAHANDSSLLDYIQIVMIDTDGKVTSTVTPQSLTLDAENIYHLSLLEQASVNLVAVVGTSEYPNLEVGDSLNPTTEIFIPLVDNSAIINIDLASSLAYLEFLSNVSSFDNISNAELDNIIEQMQETLDELDIQASTLEELINEVANAISLKTQLATKLADKTPIDSSAVAPSDSTYAEDKAAIKAFFDDVNTIRV